MPGMPSRVAKWALVVAKVPLRAPKEPLPWEYRRSHRAEEAAETHGIATREPNPNATSAS
jgi:hypothetical protein